MLAEFEERYNALIAMLMEKYGKPVYGVSVAFDQVTRFFSMR